MGIARSNSGQKFFGISGCTSRRVLLPLLVLVRIGIVADPSDYYARKTVDQASCFHLEAYNVEFLAQSISSSTAFNNLVTRGNAAIVNFWIKVLSPRSVLQLRWAATTAVCRIIVIVRSLEQTVFTRPGIGIFNHTGVAFMHILEDKGDTASRHFMKCSQFGYGVEKSWRGYPRNPGSLNSVARDNLTQVVLYHSAADYNIA